VDVAPYKRDPMDFVLWKPSGPQDPSWPSPAGIATPGRPGWHIECSAMSWRHLVKAFETRLTADDPASREIFDIHGGGIDLVFPHHENEIAQTCCAFEVPRMANVWMHNGFLQVEGEKMSKSLGNFVTIHDLLKDWPGETLRFNMLRTHYRQPLDWTVRALEESTRILTNLSRSAGEIDSVANPAPEFVEALSDDLNTPKAVAVLHELRSSKRLEELAGSFKFLGFPITRFHTSVIDLGKMVSFSSTHTSLPTEAPDRFLIEQKLVERARARAEKNWAEADRIRDELAGLGVVVKDNKDGTTTWEVAR
jgi:cysteinyl-tRNA synthetase